MQIRDLAPSRSILVLMTIGFLDLVSTAVLHAQGKIVELNPVMRPIINQSEWSFAVVKGGILFLAWFMLARYCKIDKGFVRMCCGAGSIAYVVIWTTWFTIGSLH